MSDDGEYTDEQAQEVLSDAVSELDGSEQRQDADRDDGSEQLGDAGKRALYAVRQERNQAKSELNELREKLRGYEDRDKSEAQKLAEERDRLAMQVTEYQVRETRTQAVLDAGLPAYMAEFIGAVDEETAAEQAQRLAGEVHKNNSAAAEEPHFPQGYRGRGEKRAASVTSGRDLYAERHGKN